jgi:uncharacterized protein YjbI with pentapeptide repeats
MKTLMTAAAVFVLLAAEVAAQSTCPPPNPKAPNFAGKTLVDENFSGRTDLQGANFTGAVLDGAQFGGVDLTGAVFAKASLIPSKRSRVDFNDATLVKACFQEAIIRQPDLSFAKLACTDFSRTDVSQVDFGVDPRFDPGANPCGRAKFVEATIGVRQVSFDLWRYLDFTRVRFVDLTPDAFVNADLTLAILTGAQLPGFNFSKATLTDVDLRGADLQKAVFTGAKAQRIKLDGSDFRQGVAIGKETDFTAASLRGVVAQQADLSEATLASAVLRGAGLPGATLIRTNLKGATLEAGENLGPVELSGAKLDGAMFDDAHLDFVSFRNTRLIGATFARVTLTDTDFSNSVMTEADFFQAVLKGVTFHGSSLQRVSFKAATLSRSTISGRSVDLACTQLGGADLSQLNGAPEEAGVTFLGAVLPDAAECRADGYCGTEPVSGLPYGPTRVPVLQNRAICPNGELAICSGKTWLLKDWKTTVCGPPETRWTPPSRP